MSDRATILRKLRKAKGWTQLQLGTAAGFDTSQISRWENPELADPAVESLVKLADALGCTTDRLLGRASPFTGQGDIIERMSRQYFDEFGTLADGWDGCDECGEPPTGCECPDNVTSPRDREHLLQQIQPSDLTPRDRAVRLGQDFDEACDFTVGQETVMGPTDTPGKPGQPFEGDCQAVTIGGPWIEDMTERSRVVRTGAGAALSANQARALVGELAKSGPVPSLQMVADAQDAAVLDPDYPIERVDADLRAAGLDPEGIGQRGADLASGLLGQVDSADEPEFQDEPLGGFVDVGSCKNPDCFMGQLSVDDHLTAKPCPDCNMSDKQPELTGKPWEIVGRVPALPLYENGEPAPDGEILVRLAHAAVMPSPEALEGLPEIHLSIAHPGTDVGKDRTVLAGSMLTPRRARQLASALVSAAARLERAALFASGTVDADDEIAF